MDNVGYLCRGRRDGMYDRLYWRRDEFASLQLMFRVNMTTMALVSKDGNGSHACAVRINLLL